MILVVGQTSMQLLSQCAVSSGSCRRYHLARSPFCEKARKVLLQLTPEAVHEVKGAISTKRQQVPYSCFDMCWK